MAKDGFLTPKAIANRIKAKGLQKLRWYCQVCEKQCRDENGFKCHLESESHQRRILIVAESPEKYINSYSDEFQSEFMKLLSTRYGTRRVQANHVYQEYISDRQHLHMNATKWTTLSEFVKHLGKEGLAVVDETQKGWFIQWVDRSAKALARQEAIAKKERMELDDEQREQRMIREQMERAAAALQAKADMEEGSSDDSIAKEFVRENEEEKIKLNLSLKPAAGSSTTKSAGGLSGSGSVFKTKGLNALAAKKSNPFKALSASASFSTNAPSSSTGPTSTTLSSTSSGTRKRPAMEQMVEDEMARKRRFADLERADKGRQDDGKASSSFSSSYGRNDRDRERDYSRDRERDYNRDRQQGYDRDRRKEDDRDRSKDHGRDRERDRTYDRDHHDRAQQRNGDRDRRRDSDRDRDRDRYRDREYDRDRERSRTDRY